MSVVFSGIFVLGVVVIFVCTVLSKKYNRKQQLTFADQLDTLLAAIPLPDPLPTPERDIPSYPYLLIARDGWVDSATEAKPLWCSASKIGEGDGYFDTALFYDAGGWLWQVHVISPMKKPSAWQRMLWQILPSPIVTLEVAWEPVRPYALEELQEVLCLCVDLDDDSLTQHIEAEPLKKMIRGAKSFHQLRGRLRKVSIIE
jgi:hypothetical protein